MGEGEGSYVWSSSDQDLGAPKKSLKKGRHHRKRESQHCVIGYDASHSRLRSRPRLARRTTGDRMAAHRKSDRRRDDLCAGGLRRCAVDKTVN